MSWSALSLNRHQMRTPCIREEVSASLHSGCARAQRRTGGGKGGRVALCTLARLSTMCTAGWVCLLGRCHRTLHSQGVQEGVWGHNHKSQQRKGCCLIASQLFECPCEVTGWLHVRPSFSCATLCSARGLAHSLHCASHQGGTRCIKSSTAPMRHQWVSSGEDVRRAPR